MDLRLKECRFIDAFSVRIFVIYHFGHRSAWVDRLNTTPNPFYWEKIFLATIIDGKHFQQTFAAK